MTCQDLLSPIVDQDFCTASYEGAKLHSQSYVVWVFLSISFCMCLGNILLVSMLFVFLSSKLIFLTWSSPIELNWMLFLQREAFKRILKRGPPKQAEIAIPGAPRFVISMSATKSNQKQCEKCRTELLGNVWYYFAFTKFCNYIERIKDT